MSESMTSDSEDTISVPLPSPPLELEASDIQEVEESSEADERKLSMDDMRTAMETMERTLTVTMAAFDDLKRIVFGERRAIVHASPPISGVTGKLPCCGRSMIDVPMTEHISFDGSEVTCRGRA